jgi:hypothetical protein
LCARSPIEGDDQRATTTTTTMTTMMMTMTMTMTTALCGGG